MAFKLTYATMFNPPEELHQGFDKAVATLKQNLGKEYSMIIDNQDVFADEKWDDRSPVNTDWVLAKMQKGNAHHAQQAIEAALGVYFQNGVTHPGRNVSNSSAKRRGCSKSASPTSVQQWRLKSARTAWRVSAMCRKLLTTCIMPRS